VIFRPAIAPSAVPVFAMIASLALADAVTAEGAPASVRWPNDVVVSDGRVGGTRTVVAVAENTVKHVILGIGVNLNVSRDALAAALGPSAPKATSVSEAAGRAIDRNRFVASLLNRLERWHALYTGHGPDAVRQAWNQRDAVRGRRVTVSEPGGLVIGRVIEVDDAGRLMLEVPSGDQVVASGEITTIDGERIR
jgi:BirA family biotin operon repressor/biotin-[acetyl-CoA-carboxylase] ligase